MRRSLDPGIRLIAWFELVKGSLVAIGALGLLTMIHKDVGETVNEAVLRLRVDPDNHYIHALITRLSGTTPRQLEAVSAGSFLYAALRYVEGIGLIWRQRWAAYVTVIGTAAFIPLEVVELARRVSWPKLVVIAMNVAVVWYLIARLRSEWTVDQVDVPALRRPGGLLLYAPAEDF
jgi:uncharacterized membrane protein (DUF2068 family)